MLSGRHAIDLRIAAGGSSVFFRTVGNAYSKTAGNHHSPAQHRASHPGARKKGAPSISRPLIGVTPVAPWETRYEAVRSAILGALADAWGCVLIMRQGLAAWLQAWPIDSAGDRSEQRSSEVAEGTVLGADHGRLAGIAPIVANMALSTVIAGVL